MNNTRRQEQQATMAAFILAAPATEPNATVSDFALLRAASAHSLIPYLNFAETICSQKDANGNPLFTAARHARHQQMGNCDHIWINTTQHAGSMLLSVWENGSVCVVCYDNGKRPAFDDLSGSRSATTRVYGPAMETKEIMAELQAWSDARRESMTTQAIPSALTPKSGLAMA